MPFVFIIFVLTPIIEIALFIKLGGFLGLIPTLALVLLTAIVGVTLLRLQGMATVLRAKERMAQGQLPAEEMAEGIMLAVAGAFLLTPGFFTDTVGFLLLFPPARHLMFGFLKARMTSFSVNRSRTSTDAHTFEGEYRSEGDTQAPNDKLTHK